MPYREDGIGQRDTDTSRGAAEAIAGKAPTIRAAVLAELHATPFGHTADEIADLINAPFISVRPRVTELRNDGLIEDTGARRAGRFGKEQIVWRIAPKAGDNHHD